MAKNCPFCNYPNFNDAYQCKSCGQYFDDAIGRKNHQKKDNEYSEKIIKFDCIVCDNSFSINVIDNFNVFICKKCRSIFLYEWKKNKLIINVVKKEEIIPNNIKKSIDFFNLEYPIEQENLKRNYHKLLSQYHPDKVSHLGKEFKELSEQKTKEIIENFEILQNWLNK